MSNNARVGPSFKLYTKSTESVFSTCIYFMPFFYKEHKNYRGTVIHVNWGRCREQNQTKL